MAAVAMTAMSMGLTSPGAPVALAAPVAPTASSDNYLSQLSFDQGTLVPAFISTTQEYSLTGVPYAASVGISYTTNATTTFDDSAYPCMGNPKWCDLTASTLTTVTIEIRAEDFSVRIYTVTVLRADGVLADPLIAPVTKLSQGSSAEHKCAVLRTGKVLCWGANEYGQLGLGTTSTQEFVPLTVTGVTDAVDVAVGGDHTCILRAGGAVQCMGRNDHGQLGDGTATDRSTPVDVLNSAGTGPLTGVTSISLNRSFTCATVNTSALCWGRDAGLSGWNGSANVIVTHTLPLTVSGVSDVADVATGIGTACALTNAGKVQCWGYSSDGQMGTGTVSATAISVPVTMKDPTGAADLTGVTALRMGPDFTCVIVSAGHQLCTGYNYYQTLGDGTDTDSILPVTTTVTGTAAALASVVQSAPGQYHGCALTAGGTVHCSGSGYDGVLGIGLDYPEGTATRVVTVTTALGGPPLSGVLEIASGYDSTCARTAAAVYCWGDGSFGRLGSGVFDNMLSPHLTIVIPPAASSDNYLSHLSFDQGTLVPDFISTTQEYVLTDVPYTYSVMMTYTTNSTAIFWKSVDGCYAYVDGDPLTCDLARYNSLTATIKIQAEDLSERLYTVTITRPVGVPVEPLVAPVTKLSHGAAAGHKCAVLRTGQVLCWGANEYGQLGLGTTSKEEFVPLTVTGVTDAVDVAVGKFHTCVLRAGGTVQCMGRNHLGQLGDGTATDRSTPVDVLNSAGTSPLTGVTRISLGELSTCAAANASALCWGRDAGLNDAGVDEITRTLPLTVAGVSGVVDVAAGNYSACVLTNAGKVQCWGANMSGVLGIGSSPSIAAISVPVTMKDPTGAADLTGVTALRAGEQLLCVILTSQYQLCTGDNGDLQIADGTDDSALLPVTTTVTGTAEALANVVQSAPSSYHGCTLTAGGTVHCSGSGYDGVLGIGLGTEGEASRVVTVTTSLGGPPLSGVVEVASGYDSTCARTATAVYCWGDGSFGRLGSGVFDNMLSPHLSIVIPQSTDALLGDLTIASGELSPAFVSTTLNYQTQVPSGTNVLVVTPTLSTGATAAYSSTAGVCTATTTSGACPLFPTQPTTVTIGITDGAVTRDYVILATRASAPPSSRMLWFPMVPVVK
jgi:alpha-tubulin suppressor-like RCC1 family protein